MIQDLKNICSRKHIKYLIMLLVGMFIAATIEMVGLGSIPMFVMIIIIKNINYTHGSDSFTLLTDLMRHRSVRVTSSDTDL